MANPGDRRGGGDLGRRLTKAERKEQARLERERIQRQMQARARNRNIGLALVGLAIVAVVVVVFVMQPGGSDVALATPDELLADADSAAQAAGCGDIQQTPNYENAPGADPDIDHTHIGSTSQVSTPPPLTSYPTVPPASGPHDPTPASAGVYDSGELDVYRAMHSMEHAAVIIWYAPGAADSEAVQQIRAFYEQSDDVGQSKVIVAPYDYPDQGEAGSLPSGIQMAVVAWHRLQTCASPDLAVAFSFAAQHELPSVAGQTYVGVARETNAVI